MTIEKPSLPSIVSAPPPHPLALTRQDVSALDRYVQAERDEAQAAMANGLHRAAAGHWATVLAIRPDDVDAVAGHQAALVAAQSAAQQLLQRAQQVRGRGDIEAAQRLALEALSRDPELTAAALALKQWQRDRNRASGRPDAKRIPADAGKGIRPAGISSEDWEYANLLAEAGDVEGALQLLLPAATRQGAEARLRRRSCDLLMELVRSRLALQDDTTATASVERCLRIEPRHPEALRMLQQLKPVKR